MKAFWFIALTSLVVASLATAGVSGVTVGVATAMVLVIGWLLMRRRGDSTSGAGRRRRPLVLILSSGIVGLALLVSQLVIGTTSAQADEHGSVVRVVDGDTVDVQVDDEVKRVRLLNIDTPETVDPNSPVECLGPEASVYTKLLLPAQSPVTLEYDGSKVDSYGRTLATVVRDDGSNVSALIASRGLGAPVDLGHRRSLAAVQQASDVAEGRELGLFDPAMGCTAPGRVATLQAAAATALLAPQADASEGRVEQAAKKAVAYLALVKRSSVSNSSIWRLYNRGQQTAFRAAVATLTQKAEKIADAPRVRHARIAAARAHAEAKRAAERRAAAKRIAAQRAAARLAEQEKAAQSDADDSGTSGGDLSGYTGCRKYAPGGKTWTPIRCP